MLNLRGLQIRKPLMVASGPLTASVEHLVEAERAGAGAAALKLTFVKVPFPGQMRTYSLPGKVLVAPIDKRLSLEQGTALAREAKRRLKMPIFANPGATGDHLEEWITLTRAFEEAGVDGIELNFCCPNLDVSALAAGSRPKHGGAQIGQDPEQCERITAAVRKVTELPIICKLLPNAIDPVAAGRACQNGGADALHIVGLPAAGLPPVDLEAGGRPLMGLADGVSYGAMNGPACLCSTYMATASLARALEVPIIASGGISDWRDAASTLMWGASAVAICTAACWQGFEVFREINSDLDDYLERHGYDSWLALRGKSLPHLTTPDKIRLAEGHPVVDTERCIGCGRCTKPGHCDAMRLDGEPRKAVCDPSKCIGCGVCVSLCPVGALRLEATRG